jgi:hypothetical protein
MNFFNTMGLRINTKSMGTRFKTGTVLLLLLGCIKPYEGKVGGFDDVLVVNAKITNELKNQEVYLSRSYRFEERGPGPEENASVSIVGTNGDTFLFDENEAGKYRSVVPFAAQPNIDYELLITTKDNRSYRSDSMQLPPVATIGEVTAERLINNKDVEGIGIFVDSQDPTGKALYFYFDYLETYKIIAPYWSPYDAVVIFEGETMFATSVIFREREERTCYGTDIAKSIILQSTLGLTEDRIGHLNVRFLERDDYKLTHRYCILVRQYVQNPETYSYYETLKGLTDPSQNIFSEDQPGFLAGNVVSVDDPEENVAGFFEVSSVSEKRIFFNWEDFFSNEEKPPYYLECQLVAPNISGTIGNRALLNAIYEDRLRFYDYNTNPSSPPLDGPYLMARPECGDCTVLGSNIVPDFWTE